MEKVEMFFVSVGVLVFLFCGFKSMRLVKMLFPKTWYPVPHSFFTSMGKWAVITGGSEGIGNAYAFQLAKHGMDIVIISRSLEKLEKAAKEIGDKTGQMVKVIVADFTEDDVYERIEKSLQGLEIGVLVNNVGMPFNPKPGRFLETADLHLKITRLINCNMKSLVKMCQIILPGMEKRKKGLILNMSSGVANFPAPMYTIYGASKVFVERFSRGLQAEYKSSGIIIQAVTPFGVSTHMTGFLQPNLVTFTAEDFVRTSLSYVTAGDRTHGSISHIILGCLLGTIPECIFHNDVVLAKLVEYVNRRFDAQPQR